MKIVSIEEENLLNSLRNVNAIFRKDMTYDNVKSHKKTGLQLFFEKHVFGKARGRRSH